MLWAAGGERHTVSLPRVTSAFSIASASDDTNRDPYASIKKRTARTIFYRIRASRRKSVKRYEHRRAARTWYTSLYCLKFGQTSYPPAARGTSCLSTLCICLFLADSRQHHLAPGEMKKNTMRFGERKGAAAVNLVVI